MNESVFQASMSALTANGVPEEVAAAASQVVARDDGSKENSGRTAGDQAAVDEAMQYFHKGDKS